MIGDEILVTVMEISGSTVRLGIEAPQGISIFREEIWLAVKEENRAAAEASADAFLAAPIGEPPADVLPTAPIGESPTDSLPAVPTGEPAVDVLPAAPTGEPPADPPEPEQD